MMFSGRSRHGLPIFLVLSLTLHLVSATCNYNRDRCWKTREMGHSPVKGHFCGRMILPLLNRACNPVMTLRNYRTQGRQKTLKASGQIVYKNPQDAKKFRGKAKRSFDIVEECCYEGCLVEEAREYC